MWACKCHKRISYSRTTGSAGKSSAYHLVIFYTRHCSAVQVHQEAGLDRLYIRACAKLG